MDVLQLIHSTAYICCMQHFCLVLGLRYQIRTPNEQLIYIIKLCDIGNFNIDNDSDISKYFSIYR
jgi:hypothetical protein